jgi:hypothetical protein
MIIVDQPYRRRGPAYQDPEWGVAEHPRRVVVAIAPSSCTADGRPVDDCVSDAADVADGVLGWRGFRAHAPPCTRDVMPGWPRSSTRATAACSPHPVA